MVEKKEEDSCEKAEALLAKHAGLLPEEIEAMQKLLKASRNMLHFYLNEFGLHLEKEQQSELSRQSSKSDVLLLKTARLSFEISYLACEAKKSIAAKKTFAPDKKKTSELAKESAETKKEIIELNKRVAGIVEAMKELPREE